MQNSSFDKNEPIPIGAIFYNIETEQILEPTWWNELTLNMEKEEKYTKHAEYLAVSSNLIPKDIDLGVFITIPPCEKCYGALETLENLKQINWITHRGGLHKLWKIDQLVKEGHRDIKRFKIEFSENDSYYKEYLKYKEEIKKIEFWMRNS